MSNYLSYKPMKSASTNRKGFTLIELLTIITIITILTTNVFAGFFDVIRTSKKNKAMTQLRMISQSYLTFNSGFKVIKDEAWHAKAAPTSATTLQEFAAVLALNAGLNSGEIWYVDVDPANERAAFPRQVLVGSAGAETINPDFKTPSVASGFQSWTTYAPSNKFPNEQIPLIWSRGLLPTGKWDAALGVWGSEGGHIAFGDTHVEWRTDTSAPENQFISKKTPGETTANWMEAASKIAVRELKSK